MKYSKSQKLASIFQNGVTDFFLQSYGSYFIFSMQEKLQLSHPILDHYQKEEHFLCPIVVVDCVAKYDSEP